MDKLEQLSIEIRETYRRTKSWRNTGAEFGVNPATARLIARGYQPGNRMRESLNLPPVVKVEACPTCGVVHTRKTCPLSNGNPKRKRQPRIAISKLDAASAARTIRRNMGAEFVERLVEELRDGNNDVASNNI